FAHESGIHQDGVLKNKLTYEIMDAQSIGLTDNQIVLGKHSGRNAFRTRLKELGFELSETDLNKAFLRFKDVADKKKEVSDWDLEALVNDEIRQVPELFHLELVQVS
ncbi:MAG TPA: 2-isopropylmalate synthase, partial [Cyanobacteria bacterium UBA12227]|nr:2-isopropylmalate synthase [Cyanobacteria bacterium UBA12227]